MSLRKLLIITILLLPLTSLAANHVPNHRLRVQLEPQERSLSVSDTISWPEPPGAAIEFVLHAGLHPHLDQSEATLTLIGRETTGVPVERFRLDLPPGSRTVTLRYRGKVHHPLRAVDKAPGHRRSTTGLIGEEGVFLGGESVWYPQLLAAPLCTFELAPELPTGWKAISQGAPVQSDGKTVWREVHPQEEIYLVAGRYTQYRSKSGPVDALVYLHTANRVLAERYLTATHRYTNLFSRMMGEYPYTKFALVENFWETGYGMPSFTLLGPQVIRLPFIVDTAYPHEILHNWWGNGVYVDYRQGNWSEGLTAYMADHLLREMAGRGSEFRREQLQKYSAYVSKGKDFPLSKFTSRHSGATQAVGYGKGLMLFHMLRRTVGDRAFLESLRRFYRENVFSTAGFADIRAAFEQTTGRKLNDFFDQWTSRTGAARLEMTGARFAARRLTVNLAQTQAEAPFELTIPLAVRLADGRLLEPMVTMNERHLTVNLPLTAQPVCVAVDPRFEIFRQLLPGEQPPSIEALLGADRPLFVLPSDAPEPLRAAYRELAKSWSSGYPKASIREDTELSVLPVDRPVWLLGWQNRHLESLRKALPQGVLGERTLSIEGIKWSRSNRGFVLSTERADASPLGWLAADSPKTIARMALKVPHYGKYGYLVFAGPTADNRAKGMWPTGISPLVKSIGGATCSPAPLPSLARFSTQSMDGPDKMDH